MDKLLTLLILILFANTSYAYDEMEDIKQFVKEIFETNGKYVETNSSYYTYDILKQQTPRATLLTCSDSRLDSKSIDNTPIGDIFIIRNIGNQISTAPGSIEFGIYHLGTPLLIIVGHTQCGAIKAGMEDFSTETSNIRKELTSLQLDLKSGISKNVVKNINNQVLAATKKFEKEVKSGKLTVLGLLSDIHNENGKGYGRLFLININNNTDEASIAKHPLLENVGYHTLVKKVHK